MEDMNKNKNETMNKDRLLKLLTDCCGNYILRKSAGLLPSCG